MRRCAAELSVLTSRQSSGSIWRTGCGRRTRSASAAAIPTSCGFRRRTTCRRRTLTVSWRSSTNTKRRLLRRSSVSRCVIESGMTITGQARLSEMAWGKVQCFTVFFVVAGSSFPRTSKYNFAERSAAATALAAPRWMERRRPDLANCNGTLDFANARRWRLFPLPRRQMSSSFTMPTMFTRHSLL